MKKLLIYFFAIVILTFFTSCYVYNNTSDSSVDTNNSITDISETSVEISSSLSEERIIINEISPINTVSVKDLNGNFSSWMEIKNISKDEIDLSEYSVTVHSGKNVFSFSLDKYILSPDELYLVIFNDYIDDYFYFSSNGKVTISCNSSSYELMFSGAKPNYSYSSTEEFFQITPGYDTPIDADELFINEAMSSNKTYYIQEFCDWVEIYNNSNYSINLSNYYISDDINDSYKCRLSDYVLNNNDYYIAICDESNINFNISSKGETIYLTRNDGVLIDKLEIPPMEDDRSFTKEGVISNFPTPAFNNDYNGYIEYRKSLNSIISINEVMSSNLSYCRLNGKYYDWIEIKNTSDRTIDLSNYYLSNKYDNKTKYQISKILLKPEETVIIYASGLGKEHCNFKISSDIEYIYLFDNNQHCIDSIKIENVPTNKSFGRFGNELVYFNEPTPNKDNKKGYPTISETPLSSHQSGKYTESIAIRLNGSGDIYYTLDGSDPNKKSLHYSDEVILIDKNTSLKAISYNGDLIPSKIVTYNYFIDIPSYSLPILKITTTYDDFYGENGVYTKFNENIEKKINLAFYVDGVEEFNIDCGLSIAGQGSRVLQKKSFEVKFKSEYGASKLKYDMFGSEMIEFDTLMLRGGSEDQTRSLFRDEFFTSLVGNSNDMTVWVQNYRPCNLYINDEYFGIYFIRERLNDHYYASYLNVLEEKIDVIYYWHSNEYGSMSEWNKLYSFCEENDLSIDENYRYVESQIDIDNWIDYYIARAYTGDKDLANIRIFRPKQNDGKWRIVLFDLDWAFTTSKNPFYTHFGKLLQLNANDSTIIYNLFKNNEFKDRFLSRLALHLKSTLDEDNVLEYLQCMKSQIEPDIQYEIDRWDQISLNSWNKSINNIAEFIDDGNKTRSQELIEDIKITLNLSDNEIYKYFKDIN